MSPYAKGWRWSPPLLILALLLSLLGLTPTPAQAEEPDTLLVDRSYQLSYDCLDGQTVKFDPAQIEVVLTDGDGNKTGNAQIVSAAVHVFPIEQFSIEERRIQEQLYPGTVTTFHTETGLSQNDSQTLWLQYTVEWANDAATPVFDSGTVSCEGEGTGGTGGTDDGDGDGIPDAQDNCPDVAGDGSSDGCPPGVSLSATDVQAANTTTGAPGSATIRVTNVADSQGRTETYSVWYEEQSHDVTLGDGGSDSVTFTGQPGDWNVCAKSTTRVASTCITVTVPAYTPPQYSGEVVYAHTCTGLRYTITNTSTKAVRASVQLSSLGTRGSVSTQWLAPGASLTDTTPRYFNATIRPTLYSADYDWSQALPSKRWAQPSTCPIRMIGGTKLIRWGPRVVRNGLPYAIVRTKAFHALVGYQVKGRSRIHWVSDYSTTGRHRFGNFLRLKRGKKVTLRLWVIYVDDNYIQAGKTRFTTWRTFRRP